MKVERLARNWPALAAIAALAMLAVAHAFETFGHYPPCELCLKQRDIYWLIAGSGIAFIIVTRFRPRLLQWACLLLGLMFAAECATAVYHAGVEWKWWLGPATCTSAGTHAVSLADMSNLLSGKTQHIVQCDVAAWRFLGLSMAGWNALAALKWTLMSLYFSWKGRTDHG